MFFIRWFLGLLILFFDRVFSPTPLHRDAQQQQSVDKQTQLLTLYQFKACPFCVKVRRATKRLSLSIEVRDAKKSDHARQELLEGGGRLKVPCLRIEEIGGKTTWMYESSDIVTYLKQQFPHAPTKAVIDVD